MASVLRAMSQRAAWLPILTRTMERDHHAYANAVEYAR
jgi:hypothetical protein